MRGQGGLELIVITVALLLISGIAVYTVSGSTGVPKSSVQMENCRSAAGECLMMLRLEPTNNCSICYDKCIIDSLDIVSRGVPSPSSGALSCCLLGNASGIYPNSSSCGAAMPSTCSPACDDSNSCTDDACNSGTCIYTPRAIGSSCGAETYGSWSCYNSTHDSRQVNTPLCDSAPSCQTDVSFEYQLDAACLSVDTIAPVADSLVTSNLAFGPYVCNSFKLTGPFTDNVGVVSCQYMVDGAWNSASWGAGNCTQTGIPCTDGQTFTLNMRAMDAAGNTGTAAQITSICDGFAPSSSITALSPVSGTSFTLSWSGSDSGSGVASYDIQYRKNSGAWSNCTTFTALTSLTFPSGCAYPVTASNGDVFNFQSRARDNLYQLEAFPDGIGDTNTTVSASLPSLGAPQIYSGSNYNNYFSGAISLRSAISGSSINPTSCRASVNGGAWISAGVTQTAAYCYYNNYNPASNFSIRFNVSNVFGQSTASVTSGFTIDPIAPSVNAGADTSSCSSIFRNATASDLGSGIAAYNWTRQSGPGAITFGTPSAEDTTVSAGAAGTYVIRLTVIDRVGNTAFDEFTLTWYTGTQSLDDGQVCAVDCQCKSLTCDSGTCKTTSCRPFNVSGNYKLANNVSGVSGGLGCTGYGCCFGFAFGGQNSVLDCNGYTISGGMGYEAISTAANVTIKNCNIKNYRIGIYVVGGSNTINANNITDSSHQGIYISASNDVISNNVIRNSVLNYSTWGVMLNGGNSNRITGNVIENFGLGVYLYGGSRTVVARNNITCYEAVFIPSSVNNTVANNTFDTGCVAISTSASNNVYDSNAIVCSCAPTTCISIRGTGVSGNVFRSNNLTGGITASNVSGMPGMQTVINNRFCGAYGKVTCGPTNPADVLSGSGNICSSSTCTRVTCASSC